MARRSDFAQKLLDDLRLRKEKMGITQSGARASQAAARNAQGFSQRSLQGSQDATANNFSSKSMVSADVTKIWLGTRRKTPAYDGSSSQDIIPFRKTNHVDKTVDVSMALALALSNSGKLQNIEFFSNATIGKEQHIMHHGSLYFGGKDGRSMSSRRMHPTDQLPSFSLLQIDEVSRGVRQLNKIIKDCSNGLSFGRDSIDIGSELLKGARDLEESLRMLVTLQEASDYMVSSQGKQVRLLKGKEEEDEEESSTREVNKKKLTNRPRFSFDEKPRNSHNLDRESSEANFLDHNKWALSFLEKSKTPPTSDFDRSSTKSSIKSTSLKRSLSSVSGLKIDAKNSHSEELMSFKTENDNGNSSTTKSVKPAGAKAIAAGDKVRIPNVVAKLMGLEEVPLHSVEVKNCDVQKIPTLKKVRESGKVSTIDAQNKKEVDAVSNSERKFHQMGNQKKVLQEKRIAEPKATTTPETVRSKGKTKVKDQNEMEDSPKPHFKINNNDVYHEETKASKKEGLETSEVTNVKEQTSKAEQTVQEADKPFQSKRLKSKHIVHEKPARKENNSTNKPNDTLGKRGDEKLKNREKSSHDMTIRKVFSSSSTIVASRRSSTNTADKEQLKEHSKVSSHEKQHTNNRSSAYHEMNRNLADASLGEKRSLKIETRTDREKAIPPILEAVIRKKVQIPSAQKVDIVKVVANRHENNKNLKEETRRIETPHAKCQPLKDHTSFLHELEHRLKERTGKGEGTAVGSRATSTQKHLQEETAITSLSYSPLIDDCRKSRLADQRLPAETNSHDVIIKSTAGQQTQEVSFKDDAEQQLALEKDQSEGSTGIMHHSISTSQQNKEVALTKKEQNLKQILINNQHFLNTAHALFKIKIPVGILEASEHVLPEEGSKLVLECGYEILRRKGKREEVSFMKRMSIAPVEVRCLDALVKELHDDLECLKPPGKVYGDDNDTAECLHKLLDTEIWNRNPDVNCMWDFGWNNTTFADTEIDEVIRDVEKHVLNGLINELTRDLLNVDFIV